MWQTILDAWLALPTEVRFLGWILITIAASTFVVETAFIQLMTYKGLEKRGLLLREMRYQAWFWFVVGYPADVVFNEIRGRIMFRDLHGRGWLFSNRIQYYMDHPQECKKLELALKWARVLNAIDPGHIRMMRIENVLGG